MASIVSTSSGRVFMCGIQDGCLYEMVYQAKEGWFTKKCYLVNHSAGAGGSLLPSVFGSKSSGDRSLIPFVLKRHLIPPFRCYHIFSLR
jgi:hypothetical protein